MAEVAKVKIYTDGACSGNPGPGGWAAVIVSSQTDLFRPVASEVCGGAVDTTNNRMELTAVIEGISMVPAEAQIEVYSDSEYVVKGISRWIHTWKRNGWRSTAGKPVANKDLWEILDMLRRNRNIVFIHVKGHNGDEYNERANILAQREANSW